MNLTPTVVALIGFVLPVVVSGYGACLLPRWEVGVAAAAFVSGTWIALIRIIRSSVMS